MADDIVKVIADTRTDATTLQEVVNGDADTQVTSRLGESYPSVQKAIKLMTQSGVGFTPFETKSQMTGSALANGSYAIVANDTLSNSGLYLKKSGAWSKVAWDIDERQKAYTDNAKDLAISTAATDATAKASDAKTQAVAIAIDLAATDATDKANTAKSEAISTAATDATTKADTAKSEAISTASQDVTAKLEAIDGLILNSGKQYPMLSKERHGVSGDPNPMFGFILDVQVVNARSGCYYKVARYYNQGIAEWVDRWVIDEILIDGYGTEHEEVRRIINYTDEQIHIPSNVGVRQYKITNGGDSRGADKSVADPEFIFTVDTNESVFTTGAMLEAKDIDDAGYSYIIDPSKYKVRTNADLLRKDAGNSVVFVDDIGFDFASIGVNSALIAGTSIVSKDDGDNTVYFTDSDGFILGQLPPDDTLLDTSSVQDGSQPTADISKPLLPRNIIGWADRPLSLYVKNTTDTRADVKTVVHSKDNLYSVSDDTQLNIDVSKLSAASYITQRVGDVFAQTTVNARAIPDGTGAINILMIGDSIIYNQAPDFVKADIEAHGYTANMVGTLFAPVSPSIEKHEGHSGWSAAYFTHKNTVRTHPVPIGSEQAYIDGTLPQGKNWYNPFIVASSAANSRNGYIFNASTYKTRFNIPDVDVVVINLGTNDLRDSELSALQADYYDEMKIIINSIKAAWTGVKILIGTPSTADVQVRTDLWEKSVAINRYAQQLASETADVYYIPLNAISNPDAGYLLSGSGQGFTNTVTSSLSDTIHPANSSRYELWQQTTPYIAAAKQNLLEY